MHETETSYFINVGYHEGNSYKLAMEINLLCLKWMYIRRKIAFNCMTIFVSNYIFRLHMIKWIQAGSYARYH